jgi:hypothetical protein
MKKRLFIVTTIITLISLTCFVNSSNFNNKTNFELSDLITLNSAEAESYCKHDVNKSDNVCAEGSQGQGSVCVNQKCGGWFQSDCDCYATGWE